MAVFKINKTTNYTVMSNHHLRNKELSLKAKGLLSIMLSLPQEWDYSIAGLCSIVKENESAVKSALAELKQFGITVIQSLHSTKRHAYPESHAVFVIDPSYQEVFLQFKRIIE